MAKSAPAAEVKDEEVQVLFLKGIVQLHVELPTNTAINLLLLLKGLHSVFIQVLYFHHLHSKKVSRLSLPDQKDLAVRPSTQLLQHFEVC